MDRPALVFGHDAVSGNRGSPLLRLPPTVQLCLLILVLWKCALDLSLLLLSFTTHAIRQNCAPIRLRLHQSVGQQHRTVYICHWWCTIPRVTTFLLELPSDSVWRPVVSILPYGACCNTRLCLLSGRRLFRPLQVPRRQVCQGPPLI